MPKYIPSINILPSVKFNFKTLHFKNSKGKETLIDRVQDIGGTDTGAFSNSFKAIMGYIKKLNPEYKVFYTRMWEVGDRYCVDVGSHTEFFYIEEDIPE